MKYLYEYFLNLFYDLHMMVAQRMSMFCRLLIGLNIGRPACSRGTLTIVLPHWNVMPQTQDMTCVPLYRHRT